MIIRMSDPFDAISALQRALEGTRGNQWLTGTSGSGVYPPVNVFRKGQDYVVVAEVPGAERESLDVQVKGRQVRLAGRKAPGRDDASSVHRRERGHGTFDRSLTLPTNIDPDGVKAEYRDGVLAVYLPRPEQEKPRSIEIA